MSNVFDDMRRAVREAELTIRAADEVAGHMANILRGRLRQVSSGYVLAGLKRELRDFDMTTKEWKK